MNKNKTKWNRKTFSFSSDAEEFIFQLQKQHKEGKITLTSLKVEHEYEGMRISWA